MYIMTSHNTTVPMYRVNSRYRELICCGRATSKSSLCQEIHCTRQGVKDIFQPWLHRKMHTVRITVQQRHLSCKMLTVQKHTMDRFRSRGIYRNSLRCYSTQCQKIVPFRCQIDYCTRVEPRKAQRGGAYGTRQFAIINVSLQHFLLKAWSTNS